jgi:hypothetical protein
MIKLLRNPDLYHGTYGTKNYFEGWYFKIVDSKEENIFSIIPGIYLGKHPHTSHSFIQVLQGKTAKYSYIKYPVADFSASSKLFSVSVNKNCFSLNSMSISIKEDNLHIEGQLWFANLLKWPDSMFSPGSMGYYNYIPFMQCYSQVCLMDMSLNGILKVNNKVIDFKGGKGYIEKNWGRTFPYSWIWVQCNNFKTSNTSLSCSIGHIPFLHTSFRGFLIGIYLDNEFIKFTTMNKSTINITKKATDIKITAENHKYILKLETQTIKDEFMTCYGPKEDGMVPLVDENLKGILTIELYDKALNKQVLKDFGTCAGIEYGGKQTMMLDIL